MTLFVVRNPRSKMFIADNPNANRRYVMRGGMRNELRWVRAHPDAKVFASFADAEMPGIWLDQDDLEICPLLSCGLVGDPMSRETAISTGVFHKERAA